MVSAFYNFFPLFLLVFLLGIALILARLHARVAAVVVAVVGVLLVAAMIFPSMIRPTKLSQRNECITHLRAIEAAKEQWAQQEAKGAGLPVPEAVLFGTNGLIGHPLECPAGGTYTIGVLGEKPRCSLAEIQGHRLQ